MPPGDFPRTIKLIYKKAHQSEKVVCPNNCAKGTTALPSENLIRPHRVGSCLIKHYADRTFQPSASGSSSRRNCKRRSRGRTRGGATDDTHTQRGTGETRGSEYHLDKAQKMAASSPLGRYDFNIKNSYSHLLALPYVLFQLPPFRNSDPGSHSGHSSPLPTTAVRTGTVHALVCIACAYVFLVVSHSWINIVHACCEAQLNNNADDHAENAVGLGLLPVDVILTPCAVLTSGLDASLWLNLEWYPSG